MDKKRAGVIKLFDLGSGTSRCDNYRFFNWGNTTRCACFQLGV